MTPDRKHMPQVAKSDLPEAVEFLKSRGVTVDVGRLSPNALKPTQRNYSREKVNSMKDQLADGKTFGPIVISKGGFIVDGHHRWKAVVELFEGREEKYINVIKLGLPRLNACKAYKEAEEQI